MALCSSQGRIYEMSKKLIFIIFAGLLLSAPAWYFVTLQLQYVSSQESLFYRFIIAGLFIEGFRRMVEPDPAPELPYIAWGLLALQGIFLCGINFWFMYEASHHMVSGLIPVLPAILFVPALALEWWTTRKPIPVLKILGSFIALAGVFLLFLDEIMSFDKTQLYGLFLAFISAIFTFSGTLIAKKLLLDYKAPPFWLTSRAFLFGCLFFLVFVLMGDGFKPFPLETDFLVSLFHVSLIASGFVFLLHSYLTKHYGIVSGSFLWTLVPAACLTVSGIYEGYVWTSTTIVGLLFIVAGFLLNHNLFMLSQKSPERLPS